MKHLLSDLGGGPRRLPLGKTRSVKGATDISQGREVTPERGLKNEAPVRAYSTQFLPVEASRTQPSLSPLAIFPTLFSWMRGRRVVDRGAGSFPAFFPAPVQPTIDEMNALIDERFGIATCPECHEKVAVLIGGTCRDCGGDAA